MGGTCRPGWGNLAEWHHDFPTESRAGKRGGKAESGAQLQINGYGQSNGMETEDTV